ncbi:MULTISPECIES: copper homeostasis protein CutC [unclassified Granulicatella]|uniref:copper homeostasis protein CutC n=1 Tax=unclassified Granulicatella TaxID=2630493 RepID=UPI00107407BD|nr:MULTISPECIES: copper homeostasis protein CutC [unclassified Granulicatella]MBF0779489.1 copper homeostasis protein CutC [Granulicatella sp. 19428wC4_WM01]TFU96455.1 copper homeostasis protein CutC [Granulicatella sp. WM01]
MIVEVCAGSLQDCLIAQECNAHRIELNTAIALGGLSASVALLDEVKQRVSIPVVCMVRPRGAGFCYNNNEKALMLKEAEWLLKYGADGIVFGCLTSERKIDIPFSREMIRLVHAYKKDVVFHRAFDCLYDAHEGMETLIDLGVNRLLTSGLHESAWEGRTMLKRLHQQYGQHIEMCMGAGINQDNIITLMQETGIKQCHGSFKGWFEDKTTTGHQVHYRYGKGDCYDGVDANVLKLFMNTLKGVNV